MEMFKNFQGEGLKGKQIRVTLDCPRKVAVYDAIKAITGYKSYHKTWKDLVEKYPDVLSDVNYFQFPGQGQRDTPVMGAKGLVTLMNLLKGDNAAEFRAAEAGVLVRYLGGDLSLIAEVKGIRQMQEQLDPNDPARIFGEHVEAQQQLPFSHQQMIEMQQAAKTIVAIKEDIIITTNAMDQFPFDKYSKYVELSAEMARIHAANAATEERQLGTKAKRFALTQQEDAHTAEMQRQRGAQRQRVATDAQDGITVADILTRIGDPMLTKMAYEKHAALQVFTAYKKRLVPPGNHVPKRYVPEAEDEIGKAIKAWLKPRPAEQISKYFRAAQAA